MTREKIQDSPLSRKRMVIGAAQPEAQPELEAAKHTNIKTSEHKDAKTGSGSGKIRTTIYIPEELAIRLKIYVARHRGEDASKVITRLLEELLNGEE
jgi:hypothetical protein